MARDLNASCDFGNIYLVCDILKNVVEVVIQVKTRWGKHTLTEDREKDGQILSMGETYAQGYNIY